jgi:hypothetical protein
MWNLCRLIWWVIGDLFRPRAKLEAEVLVLRQQINVLAAERAKTACPQRHRPIDICRPFSAVPRCWRSIDDRQAGHRDSLAQSRVQGLLAAEINKPQRTAEGGTRDTPVDP